MSARLTRRFSVASEPPPAAALHATPPQTWSPARRALRRHVRVELLDDRNGDDRIAGVGENVGLCNSVIGARRVQERLHSRKQLLGHLSSVGGAEDALNVVDVVRLVGDVFGYLRHCAGARLRRKRPARSRHSR